MHTPTLPLPLFDWLPSYPSHTSVRPCAWFQCQTGDGLLKLLGSAEYWTIIFLFFISVLFSFEPNIIYLLIFLGFLASLRYYGFGGLLLQPSKWVFSPGWLLLPYPYPKIPYISNPLEFEAKRRAACLTFAQLNRACDAGKFHLTGVVGTCFQTATHFFLRLLSVDCGIGRCDTKIHEELKSKYYILFISLISKTE